MGGADGELRPARVVERRKRIDPPAQDEWDFEYYMHYIGFNRRMDEWHSLEDMDPTEMETDEQYEAEDGPKAKGQKRKWEDMELHEDHDGFDPMQVSGAGPLLAPRSPVAGGTW